MKFKTTKKEIKEGYNKIIGIGYCNAQHLLNYENPIAYSTRAEGWACDYYDIDGVLISTGYAPLSSKNANYDYNTLCEYNEIAMRIAHNNVDYKIKKEKIRELLKEFIKVVTD